LLLLDLRQGVVVLRAFGPVIQLGIPERHLERAVPHECFDHLQRGAGIEELGGKGIKPRQRILYAGAEINRLYPGCSISMRGIRVKRDNGVSVMYPEELDSAKSSVTLQSTDRHGILG
jgi:hypothetical protein